MNDEVVVWNEERRVWEAHIDSRPVITHENKTALEDLLDLLEVKTPNTRS